MWPREPNAGDVQPSHSFHGYNSTRCWVGSSPVQSTGTNFEISKLFLFLKPVWLVRQTNFSQPKMPACTLVHSFSVLIFLTQMSGEAFIDLQDHRHMAKVLLCFTHKCK